MPDTFPSNSEQTSKSLISTSLEVKHFASDWNHCDQLSNFLARSVSLDRPDPFFFANLLSTILNEVFESIFHYHGDEGRISLALSRSDLETILDATIPVNSEAHEFYSHVSRDLADRAPEDLFRDHLLGSEPNDHSLGFFELAAIYQAKIRIEPVSDGKVVHLTVQVRIDDAPSTVAA